MISRQMLMQAASFSPRIGPGTMSRGLPRSSVTLRERQHCSLDSREIKCVGDEVRTVPRCGSPARTVRLLLAVPLEFRVHSR